MNKHLATVKEILTKKQLAAKAKMTASLTAEQKTQLEEVLSQIDAAIAELDAAAEEATAEQLAAIFSKAVETISAITDQTVSEVKTEVAAKLQAMQAKLEVSGKAGKKFSAKLSLSKLKKAEGFAKSDFKPYSAGVDVDAWTPESEIDIVETYRPLIGVVQGFDVSTTSNTSVKVRKFGLNSGSASVVVNHGVKPVLNLLGAQTSVSVDTYAGVVEGIADEDLEDNTGLEAEVQMEAMENLGQVENAAAITLLKGVAASYSNSNFGTPAYADAKTALAAIVDQVRQALGNRLSEISLAMNSSQWALLKDLRNENGTPIDIQSVIGDINQIVDNSLVGDEFICFAKKFAKMKVYKGKTADWYKGVKVTTSDVLGAVTAVYSEWRTDESSLRVRQRQVMYVSDATTVVKGSIAGVVAALQPEPVVEVEG